MSLAEDIEMKRSDSYYEGIGMENESDMACFKECTTFA
jgi:hypothetical protein